ncbi:MAG: hypothetical protein RRZ24_06005 [Clostridia bacterium]
MLLLPGICMGFSLFEKLYGQDLHTWIAGLSQLQKPLYRALPVLLSGLLPPLLFGATMMLTSLTYWTIPIWGIAVFLQGGLWGVEYGFLRIFIQTGVGVGGLMTALLTFILLLPFYFYLSMQPLNRLRRPPEPFGFDDVAGDVLATLIPTMILAVGNTLSATLSVMLCVKNLF